ncbi:MAG: repeat domain protein [Actinomycetia bacterium]|nr:repeat domain protein [Actinomycetes bacterium]
MAGSWQDLVHQPTFSAGTMLLLTDGSVLTHDEPFAGTEHWWKLTPDSSGDYRNGTWTQLADAHNKPLYFVCSLLADGRVFIAGGEYNGSAQVELLAAEIYDPVANTWTTIGTPAGWTQIGDAPSAVLPDGRVIVGDIGTNRTAIYNPTTNTWAAGPTKEDPRNTEETWVLLPDQTVLAIECDNRPRTEKYVAAANTWVTAGSTPVALVDPPSEEVGAAILLPDGRTLAIGATNNTALYTMPAIANQPGTWHAGPSFPELVKNFTTGAKDAPACLLPNGRVLCVVAPWDPTAAQSSSSAWGSPCYFYEFNPANDTLAQVPAASNNGGNPYTSRLMLLPTGQVLHTSNTTSVAIYTPDGAPDPMWRPTITSVPTALRPGLTYTLHGRQLNGLSQAVIYGDEGAMATNYPLVRLRNKSSGNVVYCRTHDHSSMGVATGSVVHSTSFTVPAGADLGAAELCVIANGIASATVDVAVTHKRWKELKYELKEVKELLKLEQERFKLVIEDKRKDNEGDWRERFEDPGWGEVVRLLVDRADELEGEMRSLRTFIKREERPRVGASRRAAVEPDDELPVPASKPLPPPAVRAPAPVRMPKASKAAAAKATGTTKKAAKKAAKKATPSKRRR